MEARSILTSKASEEFHTGLMERSPVSRIKKQNSRIGKTKNTIVYNCTFSEEVDGLDIVLKKNEGETLAVPPLDY